MKTKGGKKLVVRKVVEITKGEKSEVRLTCPFCDQAYDVTIDAEEQKVVVELGSDETFCEHFIPEEEWEDDAVVFYFVG